MGHIEASKDLAATPEALWATVSDLSTWSEWFTVHDKWMEEPPATLTPGATLSAKIVMLGMANKIDWTVEAVEVPTRMVLTGAGMAGVKASFEFTITATGGGSRLTVSGDFQGAMVKGALAKAVERDGKKQLDKSLDALDAIATAAA